MANKLFMFGTNIPTTENNGYYGNDAINTEGEVARNAMLGGANYSKLTNQLAYNTFLRVSSGVAYGLANLLASEADFDIGSDTNSAEWATLFSNLMTKGKAETISGLKTFSSPITSTVANGTAPFVVASSTKVTNLNADKLDGQDGSYYLDARNHTNVPAISYNDITNKPTFTLEGTVLTIHLP